MKKKTLLLLALLCGLLASCFKDEEVTYDDYCYISDVSLGNIKRWSWTTDSVGAPVRYQTSYSGNAFQMTVDQRSDSIQNRDSLLYGSDLSAVLVSVSFKGATLLYRPAADTTAEWTAYSTKDSMDLSRPLHLLVVANDGASNRIYTLKVNVHQQEGDSLYWNRLDSAVTALEGMDETKAVAQGSVLRVFGRVGQNVCVASRGIGGKAGLWERQDTSLPQDAQVGTLCQMGGRLYMGTSGGELYSSADAVSWQRVSSIGKGARLAGVGKSFLYALAGKSLLRSADGQVWEQESYDDDPAWLPDTCVSLVALDGDDGDSRVVMTGFRSQENDTTAMVWNKTWSAREREQDAEWVFFTQTRENKWLCPRLGSINVMAYDSRCLAFGGAAGYAGGKHKAMDGMYFSNDYGITWKPDYELHLPVALQGVDGPIASVVDSDKYIWIIANKEVWRGRLNRLGFLRP